VWRHSPPRPRDDPEVIKRRFLSVGCVCAVSWVPLYLERLRGGGGEGVLQAAPLSELLGIRAGGLAQAVALPLMLTSALFLGPLLTKALHAWEHGASSSEADLVLARNLVVAPLTEEFVFRACMAPLLRLRGLGASAAVWATPLFFGAAHLHHAREMVVHQKVAPARAALIVAVQFGYTTVFGWLATFLLLRTGHLAAPVTAHVFCNWMGLPDFAGAARHPRRRLVGAAYVAGVGLFAALLFPLTEPRLFSAPTRAAGAFWG